VDEYEIRFVFVCFRNIFLGETFSCYVSIHNDSRQHCRQIHVKVAYKCFIHTHTVSVCVSLLSTHADRQGVDISFTVSLFFCNFVRVFVRLRISPPRLKLAALNFARRFSGVLGRESHILGNFAPL